MSDKNKPMFGQSRAAGLEMFSVVSWCPESLCSAPQPALVVGRGSRVIKRRQLCGEVAYFIFLYIFLYYFLLFWHLLSVCFRAVFLFCFVFHFVVSAATSHRFFCTVTLLSASGNTHHLSHWCLKYNSDQTTEMPRRTLNHTGKNRRKEPQVPQSSQWHTTECVLSGVSWWVRLSENTNIYEIKTKEICYFFEFG